MFISVFRKGWQIKRVIRGDVWYRWKGWDDERWNDCEGWTGEEREKDEKVSKKGERVDRTAWAIAFIYI
jgi:hypothetical protein